MNPACQLCFQRLSPYVDGELSPAERVQVEQHLAACKDCSMRAADLRAESGLLRVGMEMLADELDFKDFSTQVLAKLTPHKPPLLERWRLTLSEMFRYQRGAMVSAFTTAAVLLAVGLPLLLRDRTPEGYAAQRMAVEDVQTDAAAHVAPVVLETKKGNAIIWVVDHRHPVGADDSAVHEEELELDPAAKKLQQEHPKGGEL